MEATRDFYREKSHGTARSKRLRHSCILLFISISLITSPAMAQQGSRVAASAISSSNTDTGTIYYADTNEPSRAMEFKERTVAASYFLANINLYFNIPAEYTFIEAESNTDNIGMKHRLLHQYYKGIPLEGLGYRVHERDGFITSANGRAVRNVDLDIQVNISEEQAFHLAATYLQTKDTVFRNGRKLIVSKGFTFTAGSFALAYQFDIDVSLIEQWRVSIDARNGQLINKVSLVNSCLAHTPKHTPKPLPYGTATGLTRYYGNKTIRVEKTGEGSRLIGQTEHGGKIGTYDFRNVSIISLTLFFQYHKAYEIYSANNTYNSSYLKPAVSVQWAAEQAYEYYYNKHNRNSFDNQGTAIKSYVHVDQNLNNAFWTHNLLAFGDGSNNNPLVELDVVAHELTHGITQYEAGLQYYMESGALNESFSDILGKAVEFHTFGDTATWQLARHYRAGGLRDMSNPNLKDQPDTYAGDLWYTGNEDNGGVHYNSGVQNFWFYLLCKGGSGVNDRQVSYSINAIGIDAAANIAYRNLTEYLSYQSDYLDSRIGSLLATADLYGKNSAIYQEVDKAWDAVGVTDEPIINSLELYDITATTVKIKGSFQPRADTATYHFEYGTTPALGSSSPVYGYKDKVESVITGLQSATKYYLRLVATNENGNSHEATEFTTISLAPLVKIKQTVDITETTATMHAQVNPNSLPTSFYFEYGLTPALGLVTPSYPMSDTTEFLNVSASVAGLQPRKTYYYGLTATNGFSSSTSEQTKFFTAVAPVIISYTPVTAQVGTEITITGQNFNPASARNLVSFGASRAAVLTASSTEIKVKVPAGASFGPISLLDSESGLATESVQEFVPTFTGEFKKNSLQLRVGSTENIYQVLVQDMDGDNRPDIVASHNQGFSVFLNVANQGDDITEQSFVRSTFNGGYSPGTLSLVDFDGNGLKDIVGFFRNGLRIYPNLSVPGFIFFGTPLDLPATRILQEPILFNDFDMDGHIDIAGEMTGTSNTAFTIFRNQNAMGSLVADNFEQRYTKVLPYNSIYFLTAGDLNNDHKPDVVVSPYDKNLLSILKNNSHPGTFEFEETTVPDLTSKRYVRYTVNDLNKDGWKDVASHSPVETGNVALLENQGSSPNITLAAPVVAFTGHRETSISPGDINGDGKVDLMVATDNRTFVFLENKAGSGSHLSASSFQKFEEYGMPVSSSNSGDVRTKMTINDLNSDGRPEIINVNYYYYGPHDGYNMEIWQNAPFNCNVPSGITVTVSNNTATIELPANTTLDQFQIEYAYTGYNNDWASVSSTTLNLQSGYSYRLRARTRCNLLDFSDYYYKDFSTCVSINGFSISNIGLGSANVSANSLSSLEVQYSPAGKNQWLTLAQNSSLISNLSAGTTYDLRYRARCTNPIEFTYKQFTTLCPKLSTLTIKDLQYNKAVVNWTSTYSSKAIIEYSADNANWVVIDESQTMAPLTHSKKYFVRGRLECTNTNSDFTQTSFTTPCPKVSNVNVDAVTPFSARINWLDESNSSRYTLRYSSAANGTETTIETQSASYGISGLKPGTQYVVHIAPHCVSGKDFTSTTFNTVCFSPVDLSVEGITHTTAELSWNDHIGGVPYAIEYSISGSNVWLTTETTATKISLAELRPGTAYDARVHIKCSNVTPPYVSLHFETSLYGETTVVPNPTDDKITIRPSKNVIGNRFSVLDNTGKIVISGKLSGYTIDLSNFTAGFYILKIDGEKALRVIKR